MAESISIEEKDFGILIKMENYQNIINNNKSIVPKSKKEIGSLEVALSNETLRMLKIKDIDDLSLHVIRIIEEVTKNDDK